MATPTQHGTGVIAWMTRNSVAANLLMVILLAGGIFGLMRSKQEVFPEFALDLVNVNVPYPGASPAEVEQGIVLAVEESVRGIEGVKRVNSKSLEGRASVSVELLLDANPDKVLADVKGAVDRILTFPEESEKPSVSLAARSNQVISLVISGEQELSTLQAIAERARRDLLSSERATKIEIQGLPPLEVSIEVPREALQRYALTLEGIASQIRRSSLEIPGGGIDTESGEILVRVADRVLQGHEFENLLLKSTPGGSQLHLGDIATIRDHYEDNDQASFYDGKPAVRVVVYRVGNETPAQISRNVREYSEQLRAEIPATIGLNVWNDDSEILSDRIDLLVRNARAGLILVVVILALFLNLRLAFWVSMGIPISFLGSFLILGNADVSINMITLFAFIVTLGMVVDDAIIVGERAHALAQEGRDRMDAAITAAKEMATPVTFAVLTTLAAFSPLFFVPGTLGKIFSLIPAVVGAVLVLSLVESFLVLPAHLGHGREGHGFWALADRIAAPVQAPVQRGLQWFTHNLYAPFLRRVLNYRTLVISVSIAMLVLTFGFVASGRLHFNFFPALEGDIVTASAQLPYGSSIEQTKRVQAALEQAARKTIEDMDAHAEVRGTFTRLGEGTAGGGPGGRAAPLGSHLVAIEISLVPTDLREFTSETFAANWRANTPSLALVESMRFSSTAGPGAGAAVAVQISHPDTAVLAAASHELDLALREYTDLKNVRNGYSTGKPQLNFHLLPRAQTLGLTSSEVARQIRSSFYGAEAIREQRDRHELKVMVRLPKNERRSEHDLQQLMIHTPSGGHIPLAEVARFDRGTAPTAIDRENGVRNVTVTAELAHGSDSSRRVIESLQQEVIPRLRDRYSKLEIGLVGSQREQKETFAALGSNYLFAIFIIYSLLAIPFRSYIQPAIIMAVIPFGFVGAAIGHAVMGYGLSIMSLFGLVALSGVVVNDSLVLVDATNRARATGLSAVEAVIVGATSRLRPILLTSLTTFFGLVPIMAETSVQARFLIPMAISLGFGVLFVTLIVLVLVPVLYVLVESLREAVRRDLPAP